MLTTFSFIFLVEIGKQNIPLNCSTFIFYRVRDRFKLTQALVVDPLYLQHSYSETAIDYRVILFAYLLLKFCIEVFFKSLHVQHWGIPLSRRFRSLKLWFVIRSYGVSGLQDYIREHCRLAKVFEEYVLSDRRFEVCNTVKVN